jgi:Tfp pilus assembly protein PilW
MTLTELMITVALLMLVLGAFLTVLDSMNRAVLEETDRSRANDEARLAIEQLDREIRSSNYLHDPQNEPSPYRYLQLRVFTQTNVPTRGGPSVCSGGSRTGRSVAAPTSPARLRSRLGGSWRSTW